MVLCRYCIHDNMKSIIIFNGRYTKIIVGNRYKPSFVFDIF